MILSLRQITLRFFSINKFQEIQSKHGLTPTTIKTLSHHLESLVDSHNISEAREGISHLSSTFLTLSPLFKLESAIYLPTLAAKLDSQGHFDLAQTLFCHLFQAYSFRLKENLKNYFRSGIEATNTSLKLEDYAKAEEILIELGKNSLNLTDNKLKGVFYECYGRLKYNQGIRDKAVEYHEKATEFLLEFNQDPGVSYILSSCYCQLGDLYCFKNSYKSAKELLSTGIFFYLKNEEIDIEALANMKGKLCEVHYQLGETDEVFKELEIMKDVFSNDPKQYPFIRNFYENLVNKILEIGKDYKTCFKILNIYLEFVLEKIGQDTELTRTVHSFMAEKFLEKNKYKEAVIHAEQALDVSKKIRSELGQVQSLNLLASIYLKIGDMELVQEFLNEITEVFKTFKDDKLEATHKSNLKKISDYLNSLKPG